MVGGLQDQLNSAEGLRMSFFGKFRSWFRAGGKTRGKAVWGKYVIPFELTNYHFYATGTTGSGKSTLLRILYRGVLPDVAVKKFDTRALFYDPKGEVFPDLVSLGLETEGLILNPFDSRCSAWDIAQDVQNEAQAKELAAIFVPPAEGPNKYFYDASRLMLTTAILSLIYLKQRDWNLRDVLLACANVEDLKSLANTAGISDLNGIDDFLDDSRESKSVRMTLSVENSAYSVIAAAWDEAQKAGRTFSIREWAAGRGPQILILGASKEGRTALATINRLLVQRAQQLLLDYRGGNARTGRRSWIFLDEFPSLGTIPYIEEFLTEGRSRGVCVVLGFQHIAHFSKVYNQLSNAILGQCTHQAFFKTNDSEMARWCADQFGRLLTYDENGHIDKNNPAATENNFLELREGSRKKGFQCVIRSAVQVLPDGPMQIDVKPRADLVEKDLPTNDLNHAGFVPWKSSPRFKPWDKDERIRLGLPQKQTPALGVPLPVVELPDLFPLSDAP